MSHQVTVGEVLESIVTLSEADIAEFAHSCGDHNPLHHDRIVADLLPTVFDMFSQGKFPGSRYQEGLGIGLALCKTLTEVHGGRITAASEGPGQGSEFVVRLPLATNVSPVATPTIAREPLDGALRRHRILVVDDGRDSLYILGRLLTAMNQEVRTEQSGQAALQAARAESFDVVISDIAMPGIDGYELARLLSADANLAGTVLVALTGYGQDLDRERTREAGFHLHLVKPVSIDSLRDLLQSLPHAAQQASNRPA